MRKKKLVLLLAAGVAAIGACNWQPGVHSVGWALRLAGENRSELEKVLDHFKDSGDKEKLAAAEYLIRYMPYHHSYPVSVDRYYDAIDSIVTAFPDDKEVQESKIDSIQPYYTFFFRAEPDILNVSADMLVENIDTAFSQWRGGKWASHLSFDEFCEYLLPYKCFEGQPLTDWRAEYADECRGDLDRLGLFDDYADNPQAAATEVNRAMKSLTGQRLGQLDPLPIFRHSTLMGMPCAHCPAYCMNSVLLMRSKGIPVAYDFIPQWGNRSLGHSWNTVLTLRYGSLEFSPHETDPGTIHYPYLKVPKIFRSTYRPSGEFLSVKKRGVVPHCLDNPFVKDVTSEYMIVSDVSVKLSRRLKKGEVPYLAVFDSDRWVPVFWGDSKGRVARFRDMGRQVVYMAVTFNRESRGDTPEVLSAPFYLDASGEIHEFRLDTTSTRTVEMARKFPVGDNIYWIKDIIQGGVIEKAGSPSFSDAQCVAEFPEWTLCTGSVVPRDTDKARYYRFRAGDHDRSDMAELYFYSGDTLLHPRVIGCGRGLDLEDRKAMSDPTAIQDRDGLTYFSAQDDCWVGFDFGRPVSVTRIDFARRSDDNSVLPGQVYTLYYWNGSDWCQIGKKTSAGFAVSFDGVPAESLLLMKCSKGREHRMFTYRDGQVRWY